MSAQFIMRARNLESVRPLSNDERRATWAQKYFLRGDHRRPTKPRVRIPVTVPLPRASAPDAQPEPQRICGDYLRAREYAAAQCEPEPIGSYEEIRG